MRKKRLLAKEIRLLRYPPTPTTWECVKPRVHLFTGEKIVCRCINNGNETQCWLCKAPRPKKPKLLWPDYEKACEKAGIRPGQKWKEGHGEPDILSTLLPKRKPRRGASRTQR